MKPIVKSKFILLAMSMIFSGCTASFEPRVSSSDLAKSRLPTAKEIKSGLEVSVEEYASPHKSRRAFDADIAPHGVLPLLLRVENKGTDNYKIQRSQIRAFLGGESLPPLQGYEAANQGAATRARWPPGTTGPRWASSVRRSRRARASESSPTRPAPTCRERG